jgi:prepilin peptidase CpaA
VNLITTSPGWLIVLLALALAAAAIEDAARLRISNFTSIAVAAAALVAMALAGFPLALWQNALVFVLLLAAGTMLFASGKVGGGDVKLLAALGLWVDLRAAVSLLVAVFLAGGILALGFIAARMMSGKGSGRRRRADRPGIPYGLAIVAGAVLVFAIQLGLTRTGSKPNAFIERMQR